MLLIRRETDYAARILLHLALLPPGSQVTAKEIARRRLVPPNLIRRIIARLAKAGLLATFRGNRGGVALARPPEEITFLEIIEAMEGPLVLNLCTIEPQECPLVKECPVHFLWVETKNMIRERWGKITLAQLAEQARALPVSRRAEEKGKFERNTPSVTETTSWSPS